MSPESYAAKLAKQTVEAYVRDRVVTRCPDDVPDELKMRAGAFVSLKVRGELRGCIGTIGPMEANAAHEIIRNAISAATQDPRFPPVGCEELDDIDYSVDVLTEPEPATVAELDASRYGVIVKAGFLKGVLLPDLEGVDSPAEQIAIAKRKAGIAEGEAFELSKFEVRRYK
jgi:AmmeMemoRadiSam system protein A